MLAAKEKTMFAAQYNDRQASSAVLARRTFNWRLVVALGLNSACWAIGIAALRSVL